MDEEQTTKLSKQGPIKAKNNQLPAFAFPLYGPSPGTPTLSLFSHSVPLQILPQDVTESPVLNMLVSAPNLPNEVQAPQLLFKAHYRLCQMHCFIFISKCSLLTTPGELMLPQTGHLLSSLALPCHFLCPDGKRTWLWHQKYFYLNTG